MLKTFWTCSPYNFWCRVCSIFSKRGFSSQTLHKVLEMATLRLQTFFARVHKNSELLLLVSYRSVASTKSARARVGVSPQKCKSWHFLPRFHEKTLFFVIKVVRKYTRNSRGLLLMLPNDYTQNLEPPKKFFETSSENSYNPIWRVALSFPSISSSRSVRDKRLTSSETSMLVLHFHPVSSF